MRNYYKIILVTTVVITAIINFAHLMHTNERSVAATESTAGVSVDYKASSASGGSGGGAGSGGAGMSADYKGSIGGGGGGGGVGGGGGGAGSSRNGGSVRRGEAEVGRPSGGNGGSVVTAATNADGGNTADLPEEGAFLCIMTRVRDGEETLLDWVHHYLEEGADRIMILDDLSTVPVCFDDPRIEVQRNDNPMFRRRGHNRILRAGLEKLTKQHNCTWVAALDADEFMTTRRHPERTLREELQLSFHDAHIVQVPWIMFSFDPARTKPLPGPRHLVMRWDHDNHHPGPPKFGKIRDRYNNIEVKPIFRAAYAQLDHVHMASGFKEDPRELNRVDGVQKKPAVYTPYYDELHEPQIKDALLLVYHYRFTSYESVVVKCNGTRDFHEYRNPNCTKAIVAHNYPELEDTTLLTKARQRPVTVGVCDDPKSFPYKPISVYQS